VTSVKTLMYVLSVPMDSSYKLKKNLTKLGVHLTVILSTLVIRQLGCVRNVIQDVQLVILTIPNRMLSVHNVTHLPH